jgi:DNA uptake protein ComE-like DNA-binding protein
MTRLTVVGLASLVLGGCLDEAASEEVATADVAEDLAEDVAEDVAEEVSGTSSADVGVTIDGDAVGSSVAPSGPSTTTTSPASTSSAPAPSTAATSMLDLLAVVPEPSRSGYDRDLFPHWSDTNGSGCDARQDTLAAQVIGLPQVDLFDRCVIIEGDWHSIYDGVTHSGSPSELDVDHVVALAEAWDSGASTWSRERRRAFANDPRNLVAVTASSNRSKGDRDLGEWRPAQRSAWCVTATMTVETKAAYGLSVDAAERAALAEMLALCGQSGQVGIGRGAAASAPPAAAPTPVAPTTVAPTTAAPAPAEQASPGCIDINSAGQADLERIIHIGPVRATEMLSLRPFASVADMDRISGIGSSRLADIVAEGLACVP